MGRILQSFTARDGKGVILRTLRESELENARQLLMQVFGEDRFPLSTLLENYRKHPSLFIGCFDERGIVGTVFGWPDPDILVVNVIAVEESHRRKGIGTALLRSFENAALERGFENFALGAQWEAVPFYLSYGLQCSANVQVKPDEIPWNSMRTLRSKYEIIAAVLFGPPKPFRLISKLYQELGVKAGRVNSDFESVSKQISPRKISEQVLEEMKRDFNAYALNLPLRKNYRNQAKKAYPKPKRLMRNG